MIIYSLVCARSGSKGLKDKNILDYNGHPMLTHSIMISKKCDLINRTFVSTDSQKYADICLEYGAEVPFLRPDKIADDLSTDYDVFEHFITFLKDNNYILPDFIIHLRPTYPNRSALLMNDCIQQFINNYEQYDSLRTVIQIDKNPQKMYKIIDNVLIPFFKTYNDIIEPYNCPRQLFEKTYLHNGCIDIIKTKTIIDLKSMSGDSIYPYVMDESENNDIDSIEDFNKSKVKNMV